MTSARNAEAEEPTFATNRKARRDYEILETYETGLELRGTEIKSIRQRRASLDDSFARIDGGELFLYNMHISPYEQGNRFNVEPTRLRKLLMHRHEIERLAGTVAQRRLTLVPLRLYQKHGLVKVELALAKGKRMYEKRERIRERDVERELRQKYRRRFKT